MFESQNLMRIPVLSLPSVRMSCVTSLCLLSLLASGQPFAWGDPLLDKANALLKAGRVESALAVYREIHRLNPKSIPAQLAMAEIAIRQFEFEKARRILENALAQHPDSPEVAATLGRLFQQWANTPTGKAAASAQDYQALANEHLTQALAVGPNNPTALTYMAEWKLQEGDISAAEQALQKALLVNRSYMPAFHAQVRLHMQSKDLVRAKDVAMHALELDPKNSATYFLIAQLLAMASHPVEAVQYAEKSAQLDYGKLPDRDFFLATQYETLGELTKAVQAYRILSAYAPKDPQIWLKLGDLHDRLQQFPESVMAYQTAFKLNPESLAPLYDQAREDTRNEKITIALKQWRKLLSIQPSHQETIQEVQSSVAGLHALHRFLHGAPHPELASDTKLLASIPNESPLAVLDHAKLNLAAEGRSDRVLAQLQQLAASRDPAVAGEAAFLLEDFAKSRQHFETIDGLSAKEYTFWADRLLLAQALVFAQVFYQRAHELTPTANLKAGMKRVQAKQALANQRLTAGNQLFQNKDYQAALAKYQEASRIYPEWDTAYLRLGDAYEQLKQWSNAKKAFDNAVAISPSLMDSKGFSKNYNRLAKRVR